MTKDLINVAEVFNVECQREILNRFGDISSYSKPQQNAHVERFNRTVRYALLSQYYWLELVLVQDFATRWIWSDKHDRPNRALGGFTPKQRLAVAA